MVNRSLSVSHTSWLAVSVEPKKKPSTASFAAPCTRDILLQVVEFFCGFQTAAFNESHKTPLKVHKLHGITTENRWHRHWEFASVDSLTK